MRASQSLPNINRDPPPHLRAHAGVRPPKGGWGQQGPGPRLLLLQNPSPTRQSNRVVAANKTNGGNNTKLQSALSTTSGQRTLQQQQHHATRVGPVNGDFSPMARTKKLAGNAEANPIYNQPAMATAGVSTAFSGAPSTYAAPLQALTTTYAHMSLRDGVPPPQSKNRSGPTGEELGAGDTGGHRPARQRRRKHVHEPGRAGVQFRPYQFGVPEKYKLAYAAMPDPPDPFNNPPPKPTNNPYVQKQRRDNEFKLVASRWVRPPRPQDLEHPDQFYFSGATSLSAPATMNLDQAQIGIPNGSASRSFGSSAPLPIEYIQPPPPPPPVHPPVSNLKMVFTPGLAPKPLEPGEKQHLQAADMFSKSSPFAGAHTASGGARATLTLTHSPSAATVGHNKGASPPRAAADRGMAPSQSAPVLVAKAKGGSTSSSTKKSNASHTPPKAKKADEPSAPGGPATVAASASAPAPSQPSAAVAAPADLPPPTQKQEPLPAPSSEASPVPAAAAAAAASSSSSTRPPSAVQSQAAQPVAAAAAAAAPKDPPKEVVAAPAPAAASSSTRPPSAVQAAPAPAPAPTPATIRAASIAAAAPPKEVAAPAPVLVSEPKVAAAPAPAAEPPSASPKGDYAADKFDD